MTTDKKVIWSIALASIIILVGGIFLLTKSTTPNIPDDQIVARNGLHWHPNLSIFIKGEKKELDDGIGLGVVHQDIHTHTEDFKQGVVHMEMKGVVSKADTKLGRLFQIWGKQFNSQCLLDQCATESGKIKMTVNGQENKDYENYLMKDGDKMEIRYDF